MPRLPDFPVEGGCICGAVRYRLTAPPLGVYACHCKDCQRETSGPYAIGMIAGDGDVKALTDAPLRVILDRDAPAFDGALADRETLYAAWGRHIRG